MLGLGCIENKRHMALTNKSFLSISHPSRSRNVFIDRNRFLLEDILRFQVSVKGKKSYENNIGRGGGKKKIIFFVHCTEICAILKHIQSLLLF